MDYEQAVVRTEDGSAVKDLVRWRERPWTIWVIAGIVLTGNVISLIAGAGPFDVALTLFSLALLWGLWRGHPGVRLYYIVTGFIAVVGNTIALLVADPNDHWDGFVASVAILALLLAPPTHEWAREREELRELKRRHPQVP